MTERHACTHNASIFLYPISQRCSKTLTPKHGNERNRSGARNATHQGAPLPPPLPTRSLMTHVHHNTLRIHTMYRAPHDTPRLSVKRPRFSHNTPRLRRKRTVSVNNHTKREHVSSGAPTPKGKSVDMKNKGLSSGYQISKSIPPSATFQSTPKQSSSSVRDLSVDTSTISNPVRDSVSQQTMGRDSSVSCTPNIST